DINTLRNIASTKATSDVILVKPANTYRVRWDMNTDTPLPPDEPAGQNPPDGAIIDYYLKNNSNEVTLEIFDSANKLIRKYSSNETPYKMPEVNVPLYWIRPQQILSASAGAHRFIWDLHYEPLNEVISFPMTAVYMNTSPRINSPWVLPGVYTVQLIVNDKAYKQTLKIKMDPRVTMPTTALKQQLDLSLQCYNGQKACMQFSKEITDFRDSLKIVHNNVAVEKLDTAVALLQNNSAKGSLSFAKLNGDFASVFNILQDADVAPTQRSIDAIKQLQKNLQTLEEKWRQLK
ncbi:MAG TPA: hypothetical protein VGI61_04650, partial [Parafilimonas sp.]